MPDNSIYCLKVDGTFDVCQGTGWGPHRVHQQERHPPLILHYGELPPPGHPEDSLDEHGHLVQIQLRVVLVPPRRGQCEDAGGVDGRIGDNSPAHRRGEAAQ